MTEHVVALARTLPFHSIGGMQSIAWDLLRRFVQHGRRVSVLTTTVPGRPGPFVVDDVSVIPVQGSKPERCDRAWWRGSRAAAEDLLRTAPATVVFSISSAGAGLLPLRRAMPNVPFVFQAHGTSWGEVMSKWRTGQPLQILKSVRNLYWLAKDVRLYRRFDALVLVGDVIEQQFQQPPLSWTSQAVRRVVIRNGVDTRVFCFSPEARAQYRTRWGWQESDPVFVFAARLHAQKGVHQTIEAFRSLRGAVPNARLLIIGDGDERRACEAGLASVSHAVQFTGAVPRQKIPGLLSTGDVFVFPTLRQEGLPMNVLEALAVGLPVITSEAMRPVLESGLHIDYVAPGDTLLLAQRMKGSLPSQPTQASRLPHHYSLDDCAGSYLRLFDELRAA
ncbi:MAG: glycosyltransferase family 4 protein [Burkholderiales bacterium]|nr:glycosyltransferase family 4 protein [Burkholderiales bacterium]